MQYTALAILILQVSTVSWAQSATPNGKWKEYVYADSGFAITLPSDPHPHKSSQMPNGTAYSVSLSGGVGFSLHTMEVADHCTDALKQQSELYASHQHDSGAAGSNGFKAISFRQLKGNGYDAIEFIQQVPNGKMDYERWVCSPHRLYVFASDWNLSEQQPPEIERIVESFRLLTKQ